MRSQPELTLSAKKEIEGYEIINLQGKTIIPGLVDTHIHFSGTTSNNAIDWMIEENEYEAIVATRQMKDVLSYGFTSVRDISRYGPMLKKAVENGIIIGPRIKTTGRGISRTGGHGDVPGFAPEIVEANHPWAIVADTEQNVRLAVRKQMRNGVDAIKIWASGGGMHSVDKEQDTHFNKREIIAMVEEASQFGLPVIAHCENLESAQICIAAGCASIEHGEELDDWCIEAMKKTEPFLYQH